MCSAIDALARRPLRGTVPGLDLMSHQPWPATKHEQIAVQEISVNQVQFTKEENHGCNKFGFRACIATVEA